MSFIDLGAMVASSLSGGSGFGDDNGGRSEIPLKYTGSGRRLIRARKNLNRMLSRYVKKVNRKLFRKLHRELRRNCRLILDRDIKRTAVVLVEDYKSSPESYDDSLPFLLNRALPYADFVPARLCTPEFSGYIVSVERDLEELFSPEQLPKDLKRATRDYENALPRLMLAQGYDGVQDPDAHHLGRWYSA